MAGDARLRLFRMEGLVCAHCSVTTTQNLTRHAKGTLAVWLMRARTILNVAASVTQGMTRTNAHPQLRAPIFGSPVWPWRAEEHRPSRGFENMQKGLLLKYLMVI